MENHQKRYMIYPLESQALSTMAMWSLCCRSWEQALRASDASCVPLKAFSITLILWEPPTYLWEGFTSYVFSFSESAYFTHVGSQVSQAVRGMHAFQVPPSWEATFSAAPFLSVDEAVGLPKPHVLLVKGQKNSGKSTFARMLVNRLSFRYAADTHRSYHTHQLISRYRRVAFLECDLGQSEFTPGGMVALNIIERPVFGPPFTHPTIPHQAHYNGAHNPRSSPSHYLRAIQTLVEVYRLDLQFATSFVGIEDDEEDDRIADLIPLVVN